MRLVMTKLAALFEQAMAETQMSDTVSAEAITAATGSGLAPEPQAVIAAPQNREARERLAVQMHQTMLRQKITPAALSARCGVPVDVLTGLIFGGNVDMSITSLEVIAQVFGLRFDYGFTAPAAR